ncbi:hypothetical protein EBU71_20960, partial [bacterium]|nr:hypothetical protein [Candidatus Elulimicrobium humile]
FKNVSPDLYEMARYAYNKKECEDFIINNTKNYCIIRPCYIVGEGDYTDRFRKIGDKYYWKDGNELGYYIEVDKLADIILNQLFNAKGSNIINPCVINQ